MNITDLLWGMLLLVVLALAVLTFLDDRADAQRYKDDIDNPWR